MINSIEPYDAFIDENWVTKNLKIRAVETEKELWKDRCVHNAREVHRLKKHLQVLETRLEEANAVNAANAANTELTKGNPFDRTGVQQETQDTLDSGSFASVNLDEAYILPIEK